MLRHEFTFWSRIYIMVRILNFGQDFTFWFRFIDLAFSSRFYDSSRFYVSSLFYVCVTILRFGHNL
ncbi:hypothetical protein C0J52_06341 [Blattella germanica]|nr:hypothetical protein C0J52_06341 [Blattella germanica]